MTPAETKWLRVSRDMPCPVCGKFDWCLVAADESACICPRVTSSKRCGTAGYLHKFTDAPRPHVPRRMVVPIRATPPDLSMLSLAYQHAATIDVLHTFAASLGVSTNSMIAFGVGWAASYPAWSFPMIDPTSGTVTGIRLRPPTGKKFSVSGGKEALFMPDDVTDDDDVLLVLEGATDAIAAHSIGFRNAVGRPSCTGGTAHLVALVRDRKPTSVVIVRDNDEPGVRGAEALASMLALHNRDVRVIAPPDNTKDMRAWVAAAATRAEVEQLTHAANARRLNITTTLKETK